MANSRTRAIKIVVVTAAISLLLSAVCCAMFVMNVTGLFKHPSSAHSSENIGVYITWCSSEQPECEETLGV